jgi:hypothetical protein
LINLSRELGIDSIPNQSNDASINTQKLIEISVTPLDNLITGSDLQHHDFSVLNWT